MILIKKKLAIGILIFSSAQFDACASFENNNNEAQEANRQALVTAPTDVMKSIFLHASKSGTNPRPLRAVCRSWRNAMHYIIPMHGAAQVNKEGARYINTHNDHFMEDCMRAYMETIVSAGVLYFRKGQDNEKAKPFGNTEDNTVDISDCEGLDLLSVYTLNIDRFLEVGGNNAGKTVTFFAPFHKVRHLLTEHTNKIGRITDVVVLHRLGDHEVKSGDIMVTKILSISNAAELVILENSKRREFGYERAEPYQGDGSFTFHIGL